jgi:purine-binding chemotaxis protein CheW
VRDVLCAIPVEHVEETMRPLPVESIAGVPVFVRGLAVVRGVPTPVVDAASLLSGVASHPTRFVTVRTGTRRVVLAVDAVVGIIEIPPDTVDVLPPLIQSYGLDAISAAGVLDADLLLVLRSTRLIPDDVWAAIQSGGTAA